MKHTVIIPLIGNIALASEAAYGTDLTEIYSFEPFANNDSHLRNYYEFKNRDVDYLQLSGDGVGDESILSAAKNARYDVVSTICPCAGLSGLSATSSADNPVNDWMYTTANIVLEHMQPQVFWGENAPALATNKGKKVRDALAVIGRKHGYAFSIYKTNTTMHGVPQRRPRTFYFFWKGDKVPQMDWYKLPCDPIETFVDANAIGNSLQEPFRHKWKKPLDNPFYRYAREVLHPGLSHKEFQLTLSKPWEMVTYIKDREKTLRNLAEWFRTEGEQKLFEQWTMKAEKVERGGNLFLRGGHIPRYHTHAIIGASMETLMHPNEERFMTIRELMTMMGLPQDFELLNPNRFGNHIAQNVPFNTAKCMAEQVKKFVDNDLEMCYSNYVIQDNDKQQVVDCEEHTPASLREHFA